MAKYNGGDHIERQLSSLVEQVHLPSELIITDDGSTDETLSIVARFAQTAPFSVHVVRNETRLGYRANFMKAASLCKSELIALCDQDDIWYPDKIGECVKRFSDPEVLLTYHDAAVVREDGAPLGSLEQFALDQPLALPMHLNPLSLALGFTQVFRGWLLQLSGLWPSSVDHQTPGQPMAHDQWFFFLASALGNIAYIDDALAAYVQHGNNTYGWMKRQSLARKLYADLMNPGDHSDKAAAATNRADVLNSAETQLLDPQRTRAKLAAQRYRQLAKLYSFRSIIYSSTKLGERIQAFREIMTADGYNGIWTLGRRSMIKDICLGLPFGPFLLRAR
jgi:glycosyltransferase involved in cell wall biosynthesis